MWVPFNENWGAFEATDITAWVKKYDPNRWVNGMSGYNYAPGYRKAYGLSLIHISPWEVSRDVKLHPRDEVDWHTLEGVRALREAFATNNPNGRLTWGFTMNALEDGRKNYREIRDYVVECQKKLSLIHIFSYMGDDSDNQCGI